MREIEIRYGNGELKSTGKLLDEAIDKINELIGEVNDLKEELEK